jgi:hypothetical protein
MMFPLMTLLAAVVAQVLAGAEPGDDRLPTLASGDLGAAYALRYAPIRFRGTLENHTVAPDPGDQSFDRDLDLERGNYLCFRIEMGERKKREEGVDWTFGAMQVAWASCEGDGVLDESIDLDSRIVPAGTRVSTDIDIILFVIEAGVRTRTRIRAGDSNVSAWLAATGGMGHGSFDLGVDAPAVSFNRFDETNATGAMGLSLAAGLDVDRRLSAAASIRLMTGLRQLDWAELTLSAGSQIGPVSLTGGYLAIFADGNTVADSDGAGEHGDDVHFSVRGFFVQISVAW